MSGVRAIFVALFLLYYFVNVINICLDFLYLRNKWYFLFARVEKLVDLPDSGSGAVKGMQVRVLFRALFYFNSFSAIQDIKPLPIFKQFSSTSKVGVCIGDVMSLAIFPVPNL